jgi:hypothetical protein
MFSYIEPFIFSPLSLSLLRFFSILLQPGLSNSGPVSSSNLYNRRKSLPHLRTLRSRMGGGGKGSEMEANGTDSYSRLYTSPKEGVGKK